MWWFLIPLILLGVLVVAFGLLVFLGRFRNGALLRPLVERLSKIGFMRRFFTKISTAALERQNPELASAMRKISTVASNPNPQAVQKAMSRLTPSERRAYLQATESQTEEAPNRQARRRVEKMQQQARATRAGGGGSASRKRKRR
ncbi:MAG TPA: hypothetical protein VGU02_14510 [Gaiellaceae bacterium]|nr:hypothetical protein [Gaiellaceae bacterium]